MPCRRPRAALLSTPWAHRANPHSGPGRVPRGAGGAAPATARWLTPRMVEPLPEPTPELDPDQPVPDDAGELLPDTPETLPPPPIEATPDDPGGDPGGVPEPA